MAEITCNIIKDLLPLYAEGLATEESCRAVQEHLAQCESCRRLFAEMTNDALSGAGGEPQKEAAAVDFMKKSNRRLRRWALFGLAMAAALGACLFLIRPAFVSHLVGAEQAVIENLQVEDGNLHIEGHLRDIGQGVSSLEFTAAEGVVGVEMKSRLKNPFAKNSFSADFQTDEKIECVMLDEYVIWENGVNIPESVSRLYAAKHAYIGSMPDNGKSAAALDIPRDLGPFTSELQTSQQPYIWTMYPEEDMGSRNRDTLNARLDYYSAMLIATVGNLDAVRFVYTAEGETVERIYSEADADRHFGSSVKEAAQTALGLYRLMQAW
ncbi:MAG: DUF4825 domain-containing protein [Firmicutes bacterium]|nr:DUF4825 domain-containing protein [Bacillota bacterium]